MVGIETAISKLLCFWLTVGILCHHANAKSTRQAGAAPPSNLQTPLSNFTFRQINDGAPPDPYPAAKTSLSLQQLDIYEQATHDMMMDIQSGLRYVLETSNERTFAIHGTGTTAMHAGLDNMIERGDKVLVLENGHWGEVMKNISTRVGAQVVVLKKPAGSGYTLSEVQVAMTLHRPKVLAVVQGESSTGVHQNLEGFGALCRRFNALLVVDFISVLGMRSIPTDTLMVDVAIGSSHKGIGGIAGLSVISLSDRAVARIKVRRSPPTGYQTDLTLQYGLWQTDKHIYAQSLSMSLLYGLREALGTIVREGMANVYKRHADTTDALRNGLIKMGFRDFVTTASNRMIGFAHMLPPSGKDSTKIVKYVYDKSTIFLSDGLGPTKGKIVRFATFATNADMNRINNILTAVQAAINSPDTNS